MKQRLEILAAWMKDYTVSVDPYTDGALETAVKRQKEETMQCIGDLLEEILEMDDVQIKNELKQK
jgi:hypothetical protein